MLFKSTLSGKKNVKLHSAELITGTPTEGDFSITASLAEKLGLYDGASIIVTDDGETVYIAKGIEYTPKKDAEGNIMKNDRGRVVTEDNGFGSIVRAKSGNSSLFKITNAAAWHMLKCSGEGSTDFKAVEAGEHQIMLNPAGNPEDADNLYTATFYTLEKEAFRPKGVKAEGDDSGDQDEAEVEDTDANDVPQVQEETYNDGFTSEEV